MSGNVIHDTRLCSLERERDGTLGCCKQYFVRFYNYPKNQKVILAPEWASCHILVYPNVFDIDRLQRPVEVP